MMAASMPVTMAVALLLLAGIGAPARADNGLQQLLDEVRQARAREAEVMREREQVFLQRRDQARARLETIRRERSAAEREAEALGAQLQRLDRELAQSEQALASAAGDLQQLGEIVRLLAGTVRDRLQSSPTRIERPQRQSSLNTLSTAAGLPAPEDLRRLWEIMLDDMALTAELAHGPALVTGVDGREREREVLRLGGLQLLADGDYLQFLPASGTVLVAPRQPGLAVREQARRLQAGSGTRIAIDPSQGQALRLLDTDQHWQQRLRDGGIIAYLILALAAIGLLISGERLLVLLLTRRRLLRQRTGAAGGANALARLQAVYADGAKGDPETLGLKLDEAVLRELPRLRRGLSTLAVLGASAPLLGLLGTVAGMIQTFQVISVFGNGDPRLMSAGISQALVTTELGLIAAIPILLLHAYLNSQSNQLVQILDEESAGMLAEYSERHHAVA